MSSVWGNIMKVSLFGESQGDIIGVTIHGIPSGVKLDLEFIKKEMKRRLSGNYNVATPRQEDDEFIITTGYFNGYTTGAPLTATIKNKDIKQADNDEFKDKMRPSFGDYTEHLRYNGFNDYRGGGHHSGRLTAPLLFAGAVAKLILKEKNIVIGAHILKIADIFDEVFDKVNVSEELLKSLPEKLFPVIKDDMGLIMQTEILKAKYQKDTIGGIVECAAINIPGGVGNPFFDSMESVISHLLFSIPSIKAVEFGEGFNIANLRGSQANDQMYMEGDKVKTYTNHSGGIVAGITNGMPIIFRVAVKPPPTIAKPQKTVDISTKENTTVDTVSAHDPSMIHRIVPVIEGVTALAILDSILSGNNHI
ncbi:chorismate synthase [Clostridium cellulovorans]|uniref:Chorismate synthase n=1 Tax=Clostridium cellulovorans (strain ATCC 35296 / DSM 3052 / OCM 3 / 743B) TaxID=573061 RepID=D9SMT2_CLOC7|nr:chorismate synthase [Clostridium cellulovorans]ADL49867.1 chorismate synthase [Clostridium cellulovorans 743B]